MKLVTTGSAPLIATVILLAAMTACQKAADSNADSNRSVANTSTQPASNSSQAEPAKTSESPAASSSGSLATPTETYKTAYSVRKNKDIAGLKRVLSKEVQDFLTEMGKEEKKTLDDQLKELADKPQADRAESRNEKIEGDRATLEYLNERGTWSTMDFVKEGGDWKISLPKAEK